MLIVAVEDHCIHCRKEMLGYQGRLNLSSSKIYQLMLETSLQGLQGVHVPIVIRRFFHLMLWTVTQTSKRSMTALFEKKF